MVNIFIDSMDEQVTKKLATTEKPTTSQNKTSLGKRKKSKGTYAGADDLDSVMNEQRKKIQKVAHANTTDGESVEKIKSEVILEYSFVQTKMACALGAYHTITLSADGSAYSFGRNTKGALGLGHYENVSLPTPIPNLPQISLVSCGFNFTVCVDYEGFIWSFGENDCGQLGTGNKTDYKLPQKVLNIPPVVSVSCGDSHTLIITNDSNLWSCGRNNYGQLCNLNLDTEDLSKPQQTSYSSISKISTGANHSLFQNNKGEIFACGNNGDGQCGFRINHNSPQVTVSLILGESSNIVQFICGNYHNLFLDSGGNVFSVGNNFFGQLGLGHYRNQNKLNKIPNIPPIKIISCVSSSCYMIDFEGNLWTFGDTTYGQLGQGYDLEMETNVPKIVNTLKDIQQISYGSCGFHFLAKNSQNQIIATGRNNFGQLGTGDNKSVPIFKEINSQFSTIWRNEFYSRAKSARK